MTVITHELNEPLGAQMIDNPEQDNAPSPVSLAMLGNTTIFAPERAEADRSQEVFRLSRNPETYEINIDSDLTLADYEKVTPPEQIEELKHYAESLQGKSIVFVNATMEGGGVAMLRPTLIHLLHQLDVDAHWYTMEPLQNKQSPDDNPYDFTKKMHNITQRRTDERIDEAGKDVHRRWSDENEKILLRQDNIKSADVIIIDDPQPARMIRPFKAVNPDAKIGWRNHIDNDNELMADPTTPQGEVWQYLRDDCGVGEADFYIYHPDIKDKFVPKDITEKTYLAPATVDEFDDLNRKLSDQETVNGLAFINNEIVAQNTQFIREGNDQDIIEQIDPDRKQIGLVARFDESKGMDKAMAFGVEARNKMRAQGVAETDLPQIVLVGNGSIDDPSGPKMYRQMLDLRQQYPDDKDDIIIMRLKHNYQAMNALMNTCDLALQTSDAEGCETRITDWIGHGVPVAVANRGGMPPQVKEGLSGFIIDFDKPNHGIEEASQKIADLLTIQELYDSMKASTKETFESFNAREYSTVANALRWTRLITHVLKNKPADKTWHTDEFDLAS